jgi:hypothetical protein
MYMSFPYLLFNKPYCLTIIKLTLVDTCATLTGSLIDQLDFFYLTEMQLTGRYVLRYSQRTFRG